MTVHTYMCAGGVPGRADERHGPRGATTDVGHPAEVAQRSHHAADDALHGRSRLPRRPNRHHDERDAGLQWLVAVSQTTLW